jgi:hypothetical protein
LLVDVLLVVASAELNVVAVVAVAVHCLPSSSMPHNPWEFGPEMAPKHPSVFGSSSEPPPTTTTTTTTVL